MPPKLRSVSNMEIYQQSICSAGSPCNTPCPAVPAYHPGPITKPFDACWRLPKHSFSATKPFTAKCADYDRLHAEAENVIGNLAQVSTLLLELLRLNDFNGVHRLDKELELTVGEKERCIGALRRHVKDHNFVIQAI